MPAGRFATMSASGPQIIDARELFRHRKVVLFGVPGAFTPTCSKSHLPGFLAAYDAFREKGVDTIACMAVNDVHVMNAWGKDRGVGDRILMLADGNGEYADALGLLVDSSGFLMGKRSRRFAIVADDGIASFVAVDEPGKFELTGADIVLNAL